MSLHYLIQSNIGQVFLESVYSVYEGVEIEVVEWENFELTIYLKYNSSNDKR